jgi:hypothetical protein
VPTWPRGSTWLSPLTQAARCPYPPLPRGSTCHSQRLTWRPAGGCGRGQAQRGANSRLGWMCGQPCTAGAGLGVRAVLAVHPCVLRVSRLSKGLPSLHRLVCVCVCVCVLSRDAAVPGVATATNLQQLLSAAGMPESTPVSITATVSSGRRGAGLHRLCCLCTCSHACAWCQAGPSVAMCVTDCIWHVTCDL